jgi:hypothetical protein
MLHFSIGFSVVQILNQYNQLSGVTYVGFSLLIIGVLDIFSLDLLEVIT